MIKTITICGLLLTVKTTAAQTADTSLLHLHLRQLVSDTAYRHHKNTAELDRVAAYIRQVFEKNSDSVWTQSYEVKGRVYHNVICSFGLENKERIIAGAHYDVCGEQQGADDNASGVAGLLELSRLLKGQHLPCRIDLVAYTLEEPPYFRTEYMGSYVHARYLHDRHIPVKGMISLEMIGYFSEERQSQTYPVGLLKMFYGSKANYIAVVRKLGGGKFSRKFKRQMKHDKLIRTKSISAPKKLTGIDFSDHLNYWKFGFDALMITDTSFYRNRHYHQKGDTIDLLDLEKMALVITQVYHNLTHYRNS